MQGLGGLTPGLGRGATMSGNKADAPADPSPIKYGKLGPDASTPTADTFSAPAAGLYQLVAIGGGGYVGTPGGTLTSGGGGALGIITRRLRRGDVVSLLLGNTYGDTSNNNDTVLTFPDGSVARARGGKNGGNGYQGGTASGFDINVSGSQGGPTNTAGGEAGYYGPFGGGAHPAPGHGGRNLSGGFQAFATPGRVTITYVEA